MKRLILSSNVAESSTDHEYHYFNNVKYHVRFTNKHSIRFTASISEIHPYDEAEYAYALISENKSVKFCKNGKLLDKMELAYFDEMEYEMIGKTFDDYREEQINYIIEELYSMNKDVEPIMVHY